MPWSKPADATRHTHKADTPTKQRQWLHVANGIMEKTGDDVRAIRAANSVVGKSGTRTLADYVKSRRKLKS